MVTIIILLYYITIELREAIVTQAELLDLHGGPNGLIDGRNDCRRRRCARVRRTCATANECAGGRQNVLQNVAHR